MADKTINDANCIVVCSAGKRYRHIYVDRKPLSQRKKCPHKWRDIAWGFRGHGRWVHGCLLCGALAR